MESISEEDIALAEELVFNGYVEKEYKSKSMTKVSAIVCSTTAGEISIIEEMILDYVNQFKDEDGEIQDLPTNNAKTYKQMLEAAHGIKSING